MSEEILKALMQLFALLVKQDGGVNDNEIEYVRLFLVKQIGEENFDKYFSLFTKHAEISKKSRQRENKLISVKDSVKILGISKKIGNTLDQKQKVIVLVRLLELVYSDKQFTDQRMSIINTVAKVFKVKRNEYRDLEMFALQTKCDNLNLQNIAIAGEDIPLQEFNKYHIIPINELDGKIIFVKISSVDLYFVKYTGEQDLFLNGLVIKSHNIYIFSNGSTLKLPKEKPIYYSDIVDCFTRTEKQKNISFNVKNIEYKFKSGDIGLRPLSLSEKQGRLVGILGASGAGKTTLLNVLSGIEKPTAGSVFLNGIDIHKNKKEREGIIGYIPQDDLLIEELTVSKNLYFNAKLCFKNKTEKEITEIVNKTLSNLGLKEISHLKVGSPLNKTISGGQRKRLNIALELIREPSVLFVDEPTSGLSSQDSENVMNLLRELVTKGKLIFVVIHQPSSDIFKMFDNVAIMDTGGYMIYYGNPVESVIYFKTLDYQINSGVGECSLCGNINPELIFNIVEAKVIDDYGNYTDIRKIQAQIWSKYYIEKKQFDFIKDEKEKPEQASKTPNWFTQTKIFFLRDFLAKLSNKQYIILNLTEAPILAFVLSFLIKFISDPESDKYIFRENENIPQYIFMTIIVALFLGMILSAEEIFKDRKILKREKFLNLSRSGYLISKIIILIFISAIQAILFVLIGNFVIELRGMILEYWLAFFTIAVFANLLGLNISASFNSAITIYIIIPLLIIPQMILGGAMFSFEKLNRKIGSVGKVPLVAEFIASKWVYEGLIVNQFKKNEFEKEFFEVEKKESYANFKQVYLIPELENKLDECLEFINFSQIYDSIKLEDNLKTIKNEIIKENYKNGNIPKFELIDKLTINLFNDNVAYETQDYLHKIKLYYKDVFNEAYFQKENISQYLREKNPKLYTVKKNKYHNDAISEIVKKVYEKNKLLEYKNELFQNIEPIFLDADNSGSIGIRSHFLSPNKYFFGKYYDTYWFNILFVWIMSLILYITLYFDLLKKLLNISSILNLKKRTKKKK